MVKKFFKFVNGYSIICMPNRVSIIKIFMNIQ